MKNNVVIGFLLLVILLLLVSIYFRPHGWGMMGWMNDDDSFEEMEEEMDERMFDNYDEDADNETKNTPTSADNAPVGSMHNLPVPEAVAAVRSQVATEIGVSEGVVIVLSAYEKEWPNGCLGLGSEEEMCTQAIVSGYEVTVQAEGKSRVFRTNEEGTVIREEK